MAVLDALVGRVPRTWMLMLKLMNRGTLRAIFGTTTSKAQREHFFLPHSFRRDGGAQ